MCFKKVKIRSSKNIYILTNITFCICVDNVGKTVLGKNLQNISSYFKKVHIKNIVCQISQKKWPYKNIYRHIVIIANVMSL